MSYVQDPILHFHSDTGGQAHSHVHVAPARDEADHDALQASFEASLDGDGDDALTLDLDDAAPLITLLVSQGVVVPSPIPGHPGEIQVESTNLVLTRLEARKLSAHLRWLSEVL